MIEFAPILIIACALLLFANVLAMVYREMKQEYNHGTNKSDFFESLSWFIVGLSIFIFFIIWLIIKINDYFPSL